MSCQSKKKIGIMGGTFNPIHIGHINIATAALKQYQLDTVWFMPNKIPAYKTTKDIVDECHRVSMINLAIKNNDKFEFSSFELEREGYTYTYETLLLLKKRYPEYMFYFIMGADSLLSFSQWKNPKVVANNCIILVACRDDIDSSAMDRAIRNLKELYGATIYKIQCERIDISSNEIRNLLKKDENVSLMLEPNVLEYISENNLYGL